MVTCASCGQANPDGFQFCGACGRPLRELAAAPREERKRVSVVFCDLVGFTARAETMDPEEVRALLQPYHARVRRELERYGGTVEKFIGDAVVAVFGAPAAHEDDPERAVRAGLAIRDALAGDELHVRIGVTTGEALVSLDARPDRGEGIAAGDVVNTAARLQSAAPIDAVLVDESTERATRRTIEYSEHEPVDARGKVERVPSWVAVAARSRLGLDVGEHTSTPLVGREFELELLTTALARARRDRAAQLVTLVGVPGIGKSRLVLELFRHVEEDRQLIHWRQGRCLPYGEGVTLWALGEIVKAHAGVLETDPADVAEAKLRSAVRDAVNDDGEAAWVERHLRPLAGLEGSPELSGDRRDEAFAAWRRFFEGVAEHGPLVLIVEDLQWADDTLLDFFDHLLDWAADIPLLVVATARPELLVRRPGWGGGKTNAVIQSLAPLSDEETAALVHSIAGRALMPADVRDAVVEHAGGNPLYAEEFGRMLTERRGGGDQALPESVQGIIAARLDTLGPAEKALLQDAAVLGKVFWIAALEALTGDERWRLERQLHELERREMVRRDRQSVVAGERQYAFRHLLVRDVAYGQIPRARRADRHAAAARWIESLSPDRAEDRADMLAHHWSSALRYAAASGRDVSDLAARARSALVDAGDRSLGLNAPLQAAEFYERALGLGTGDDVRLRYARSLYLANDERARRVLEDVRDRLAASGDREGEAYAEAMLSHLDWLAGEVAASTARIGRAVSLVEGLPPSEVKARVLARAAGTASVASRTADAVSLGRQVLELADKLGLDELRVSALTTIGTSRMEVGDDDGRQDLERALDLGLAIRSPEAGRAAHNLGVALFLRGDVQRFHELHGEGLRYDERFGNPSLARFSRGSAAGLDYFVGDWAAAERKADAFILECEHAPHYQEPQSRVFRALIRLAHEDLAGARADVERAVDLLEKTTDPQARGAGYGIAARVLFELDDPRAASIARQALDLRFGTMPEPGTISLLPPLDLPPDIGDRLRTAVFESASRSLWVASARAALERRFLDAAEIYARMPFRHAEAEARVRAAEDLLARGRRAEADDQLERALAFWRGVGATRYVTNAQAMLRATA